MYTSCALKMSYVFQVERRVWISTIESHTLTYCNSGDLSEARQQKYVRIEEKKKYTIQVSVIKKDYTETAHSLGRNILSQLEARKSVFDEQCEIEKAK